MRISDWSSDVCSSDLEALVEAFKSRNALLQNSLTYFSYASRQLGRSAGDDGGAVAREIGVLANAMLRFTSDPREEVAAEVAASIGRLDRPSLPRPRREAIRTLVAHGRLIMARSEEHTSELQSLMRISYAVFC